MHILRQTARWVLLIACIAFGLLYLNGAAASWWMSWGPPNERPLYSLHAAIHKLGVSAALFCSGPMLFLGLKKGFSLARSRYKYFWIVVMILALGYPRLREWALIDACLDSGGAWDASHFECNRE